VSFNSRLGSVSPIFQIVVRGYYLRCQEVLLSRLLLSLFGALCCCCCQEVLLSRLLLSLFGTLCCCCQEVLLSRLLLSLFGTLCCCCQEVLLSRLLLSSFGALGLQPIIISIQGSWLPFVSRSLSVCLLLVDWYLSCLSILVLSIDTCLVDRYLSCLSILVLSIDTFVLSIDTHK